ncbi:hypothetical protein HBI64_161150 [Parastagonospora nodorum]|nr:hypothetical protein HBI64_161150 [Parastagonospora nodorum]KAH6439083.1 hypothetical protein HBI59_150960 [Parastagonospora nodorum]
MNQQLKTSRKRQFPEPMLWLIFRGLAECLHMMHTGRTVAHNEPTFADRLMSNANLPRAAGWRPLTNVDIKLRNVVIGRPTPHWYASYKTALMIDFGHTAHNKYPNKASKLQSARPVRYKGIGTQGCRPPEQFQPPPANRRNTPIDVRASIWNTGKIMYELMNQEFYNLSDPKIDIFKPSATFLGRRFRYWPELEILVRTCLAADPDARPHLNEILWASADSLEKWEQTAMRVSGPDVPPDMLWEWKKEDFALDAVVPKHWHWHARKRPGHDDSSSEDDDGPLDTRRPSSNHESESDGEFGDESYRPSTAEQIMERGMRHVAHPVVAPRDGGAASGPPSSRRLSSSEQSEGEFGGESYRPSTTQEVTKEIEEARRVRGGPALIAAPGVGDAVALDGRTAVDERVPGAKRKSSEDGGGRSKRSRRSW